jgi:hypothetical protein
MSASIYSVRFVHKISPRDTDTRPDVELADGAFADRKALGAALRKAGVLSAGCRVTEFRVEGDRVIVFPKTPGFTTDWHSVILTHQEPAPVASLEDGIDAIEDRAHASAMKRG